MKAAILFAGEIPYGRLLVDVQDWSREVGHLRWRKRDVHVFPVLNVETTTSGYDCFVLDTEEDEDDMYTKMQSNLMTYQGHVLRLEWMEQKAARAYGEELKRGGA